jgi:hypothetical protein
MKLKADPRLTVYFTPHPYTSTTPLAPFSTYKGTVPGDATTIPYSRFHTYLKGSVVSDNGTRAAHGGLNSQSLTYTGAAPSRMLTFAEYNFIRAEAALVYGAAGDANEFFKAGIEASLANAGITGTSATTYVTSQTSAPVTLQRLIEEKYIANLGVAVEQWTDWRRTGFPVLSVSPAAAAAGNNTIPRILVYPLSEQTTNIDNVPGRASMALKSVFWDN